MFLTLLLAAPAFADLPTGHDQAGWDRTAAVARAWLAAKEAKQRSPTLEQWEDLRITLTVERELALEKAQQGSLDTRILQAQLAELGAPPAKGEREAPSIASRRGQLNAVLATAELPLLAASEAHARAGVLIGDVNRVIDRKTRAQLLERVDTVLGPTFWRTVAGDLRWLVAPSAPKPSRAGSNATYIYASLVAAIVALLAAIFMHRWLFALERRSKPSPRGHLGFAFLKDFADIALPMLVILLALALLDGMRAGWPSRAVLTRRSSRRARLPSICTGWDEACSSRRSSPAASSPCHRRRRRVRWGSRRCSASFSRGRAWSSMARTCTPCPSRC